MKKRTIFVHNYKMLFLKYKKMYKPLLLLLLLVSFFEKNNAQTGVKFEPITWEKALEKAKENNKIIFLDAYTTWCAPCKMMEKEVFPRVPVGDFFNSNFICVKMDMERGEGIDLARRFNIHAFPTFIFVDAKENVLHADAGGKNITECIAMGNLALNPQERLATLDKKFAEGGNADVDFLKTYIYKRFNLQNNSHQAAAEAYLNFQNDWTTPENMEFIVKYIQNPGSKAFAYLLENKAKFVKQLGKQKVESKIESCIYDELYKGSSRTGVETMQIILEKQYGERAPYYLARYKAVFAQAMFDAVGFQTSANEYFAKFPPEDPAEWSAMALYVTHFPMDKILLKTALLWVENGIKQEDNFDCRFAKAQLLKYGGKKRKAKKTAKEAIAWAKKNGENTDKIEKFLEDL